MAIDRKETLLWSVIIGGVILLTFFFTFPPGHKKLQLFFFRVGQGDAALIKTPNGTKILVDGGPFKNILNEFGKNLSFWDRTFDYVIMTHPDKDHYEGLISVIKRYKVKNFLMSGAFRKDESFEALLEALAKRKAKVRLVDQDSDFSLDDGTKIDFLWPEEISLERTEENTNQATIVFLLTSIGTNGINKHVLFTGDIDETIEHSLLSRLTDIDILKVAHHGSRFSSSKSFLKKVEPEIAVISVGKNRYGHPRPETLRRLTEVGAVVYRTDMHGTVKFSF